VFTLVTYVAGGYCLLIFGTSYSRVGIREERASSEDLRMTCLTPGMDMDMDINT
jgi:hypothetical protein